MAQGKQGGTTRERAQAATAQRREGRNGNGGGQEPPAAPGTEIAKKSTGDTAAYALISGWAEELGQALAPGHDVEHFIRMSAILLSSSKQAGKIAECTRPSIYNALAQCAHYGLLPDGRHAAVVPYRDTLTFIPMKDGLIQLAYNTGQIRAVVCKLIYRRDEWAEELGPQGRGFIHRPVRFTEVNGGLVPVPRGRLDANFQVVPGDGAENPPILAYCYATFADGQSTEVEIMTPQEAIEIRDRHSKGYAWAETGPRSQGGGKKDSFWHTDPELAWLKSVLRRAMHYIPKSAALVELLLADDYADSRRDGQVQPWQPPPMPPGGPAAAWEGDVEYGAPGAVVDGEVLHDEPPDEPPPPSRDDRNQATKAMKALFDGAGWGGSDAASKAVRMNVLAWAVAPQGPHPVFENSNALDAAQAVAARRRLHTLAEECAAGGEPMHDRLAAISTEVAQRRGQEVVQQ